MNKEKSGKYIYKDNVKIWNNLNDRSIVAQNKNKNKNKKIRMECKSEGGSVRKKRISKKIEKKVINIMKQKKKDLNSRLIDAENNKIIKIEK